jgi:hypothetical protein
MTEQQGFSEEVHATFELLLRLNTHDTRGAALVLKRVNEARLAYLYRCERIIRECENLTSGAEEDRGHDTLMARFIAMAEGKPDNETP